MDFKTLLKKDFIIIDGAQGTEIQKLKKEPYDLPELVNFSDPEIIKKIIRNYAESGSDIVCANTFSANRLKLSKYGKSVDEVIGQALKIAHEACKEYDTLIALDVTTLGQLLEPTGTLLFEEAYEFYKEIMLAGEKHGADLVIIETMTDLYETKAALLACKENTKLPVICSMTFESNMRTFTGCTASAMALTLTGLGADVLGVNCSLGPAQLLPVVKELLKWSDLPIMVKPNAGLPNPETGCFTLSAEKFASDMKQYAEMGVKILGGCCGTTPEFIKHLSNAIKNINPEKRTGEKTAAVCSASTVVEINQPRIIGERINPTGKKLFKEALKNSDFDYILSQALEQTNAGAEILDVNVGLPDIDEKQMMVKAVKSIQSVCDAPLQLDSTKSDVLEAALRVYNGKAIVNSVNGDDEMLDAILPVVKKYGASVVGLTLDKNGIPKKAEERFIIAEKILARALSLGIKKEDVYIDCLTLTASAEQEAVMETLKAVKLVKEKLDLKTVLGVSNISFGLPNREIINSAFLSLALSNGLDLPIMNPNTESMTGALRAFRLLSGYDKNSAEFVSVYAENANNMVKKSADKTALTLDYAIGNGLKNEASKLTKELLLTTAETDIISQTLIPVLDQIGLDFEKGKIFLPQLILAAEAAGACFDVIKEKLYSDGTVPVIKGKIIMATVKGDIHDIGKNIVKVLLENYGYQVIDLGKDVSERIVAEAVREHNVKLVGLSALMTTTLPAMERTISLIKTEFPDCLVMVGGAVLTEDYSKKIGADFYAADAKNAVDIAKSVFG